MENIQNELIETHTHILELRKKKFVLWRPGVVNPKPTLFIGTFNINYSTGELVFRKHGEYTFEESDEYPDLWYINVSDCELKNDTVYYYWYKVINTNPYENNNNMLYCTDPFATVIDERIQARNLPVKEPFQTHYSPASVIFYKNGFLLSADPDKQLPSWEGAHTKDVIDNLPSNNKVVIYEIPPRWSYYDSNNNVCSANGNFRQIEKMIAFKNQDTYLDELLCDVLPLTGKKYLKYLGINALELTPPANSSQMYNWGYGTALFFAADYSLSVRNGRNADDLYKPATDFVNLVKTCHKSGIRFYYDAVMAFASNNPYRHINFTDFFIHWNNSDPEQYFSDGTTRDGFGGDLVKYKYYINTYNPSNGKTQDLSPSREYMKVHLKEWIKNKGVSALRLDSVININSYNFLSEVKNEARAFFNQEIANANDKFIVIAEELAVPESLLKQEVVDGQWNELFKRILRKIILGKSWEDNSFEWSIKKMIDCRLLGRGFSRGDQAINYITSHDVGGYQNERFYNYLDSNGISDFERRIKLAFSCLMTAIGTPMILAGEEFGEEQDQMEENTKQRDSVNYTRLRDYAWRKNVFHHARKLIQLRTSSEALFNDNIEFIHTDFNFGRKIIAWKRGQGENIVITVANFSNWESSKGEQYIINNWPKFNNTNTPAGKQWIEVSQSRIVDDIDLEMIMPWEAKVYTLHNIGEEIFE